MGYYETIQWAPLIIFDTTNVIYCFLGVWFAQHCLDKENNLRSKIVFAGKLIISLVIIIQWNFLSYMVPSREFWAFFALFAFVSIFFLDTKYVIHTIGILVISIVISWIVKPNELLPVKTDPNFLPEMILRCILIVLISACMILVTYLVEKMLVRELENIAEYDSLTLLRNRRTLNDLLDIAIQRYEEEKQDFCFLMCDIDDFKVVNDTHGHPFGDIVLKNIAKQFILKLGDKNNIFRYGGEEMCAILFMDLKTATKEANLLRESIQRYNHVSGQIKVNVTMSMGLVEYRPGLSKADLIKIADSNLYYAKAHGKNKVIS